MKIYGIMRSHVFFVEVSYINGGVTEIILLGIENDKFKVFDWSFIFMQLGF